MAEPMPPAAFAAALDRAGLVVPPEEAEAIRQATALLAAYVARLRAPLPAAADEPATGFAP